MSNFWFISDTHFGHANMLRFKKEDGEPVRPGFKDVYHMDEVMIERWNDRVREDDHVYHLGDVTFQYGDYLNKLMPSLRGKKRLFLGNHDRIKGTELTKFFPKVELWRVWKDHDITLSHIPLHEGSLKTRFNLHGHIHYQRVRDLKGRVDPRYICCSVEHTDYAPWHLDEVLAITKRS